MFRGSIFIFFILYLHNSSCIIDDLYETGRKIWDLHLILDKMNQNANPVAEIVLGGKNSKNKLMKNKIKAIFRSFDRIELSMNPKKMTDSSKLLRSDVLLYASLTGVELSIEHIDDNYERLHKYMDGTYRSSADELGELMKDILGTVEGDITLIRKLIIEDNPVLPNRGNVVKAIVDHAIRLYAKSCDDGQLTASILVQLLRMVIIAELKTNLMLSLGNLHQYFHSSGWKTMNSFARKAFEEHFSRYVNVFHLNINGTDSLYLRACDPADGIWIRNTHFYELEETIQTTIFHYHWSHCKHSSCNDVWFNEWPECMPRNYDKRTGCAQTTANCAYLDAIKACALKSGPYKFQYLNSTKLGALGKNFTCPEDNGYMIENEADWSIHRGTCACNCYGDNNKISLTIMASRLKSKWVIIGLRFVWRDGILHIQPKEGKLEANGHICRFTERWILIPHNPRIHEINRENRVFFFDDLRLPESHVLTGVKFNKVTRGSITGFAIEIFGMPFDYKSGIQNPKNTSYISVRASDISSGTPLTFERICPIHVSIPQIPDSEGIGYVTLRRSELSVDFGQSTLPFFDAVPIVTNPPSILGGLGIFHKGTTDNAGFISLRVFGVQYNNDFSNFQAHCMANGRVLFNNSNDHTN